MPPPTPPAQPCGWSCTEGRHGRAAGKAGGGKSPLQPGRAGCGYIPELAKADRDELGICVVSSDGRISSAGEYRRTFTIQSIIKPILLLLALMDNGEDTVRARVGVEATGKPFDAINYTDQALLSEHLNPMVNMGAILLCTLIHGTSYSQRLERLLELTRRLAGNPSLSVDEAVYRSEKQTGSRNRPWPFCWRAADCFMTTRRRCWTVISGPAPSGWTAGPGPYRLHLRRPGPPLPLRRAAVPRPICPLCQRRADDLRHVQRLGGLRRQSGTASQKRRGGGIMRSPLPVWASASIPPGWTKRETVWLASGCWNSWAAGSA